MIKDNPTFAAFAKDLQRIFIGRTAEEHQRDSKAAPESCIQAENEHAEASPATVSPKEIPSDMSATSEKTETPAVPETAANARDQVRVADAEQQHDEAALVGSRIAQAQFDLALSPAPPSSESPTDTMVAEAAKEPEAQPSEIIVGGSSNAETGTDLVPASDQQTRLGETEDQRDEAARCAPMITEAHEKPPLVTDEQKHAADAGETELAAIPGASEQAQAHFDRGVMLGQEGRAAEAAQEFREAIRCDPDRAEAHYNLALALSQLGRIGEEERELREAIRCNPDYAEAHYNLAVVLRQQGRVEQAEKEFQEAIRCNPDLGKTNE
ncbi:MAG: tetratricopeptide repeat protein [Verrucomicrobiae bacterium]|nr:tetratricopeptide repeat protein [Verrucomicrobiae bacterium]